ncbi:MAG: hypothetical protein PUB11_04910 [Oscillospiraceae bacterium]|nr:hypothetical protein [Oscillospiraceae bacterium]
MRTKKFHSLFIALALIVGLCACTSRKVKTALHAKFVRTTKMI